MERKFNLQLFAVKASNQVDVLDITDGYSVILTCESYTFLGDTDSVNGTQSINVTVRALRGAEEIACEIGNITCPTGLSAVSNGQSVAPVVTITATSALTTSGSIIIPVIIGEVTINKTFSWSIAFKGTDGTSVTILDSEIVYQASSSGTTPPTGNWSSTPIAGNPGQYVWTRTTVEYSDGKTTVAYAVSRNGVNGADGVDGADGADGTSVIITNQEIRYQASNSGTTPPTGTWSANRRNV